MHRRFLLFLKPRWYVCARRFGALVHRRSFLLFLKPRWYVCARRFGALVHRRSFLLFLKPRWYVCARRFGALVHRRSFLLFLKPRWYAASPHFLAGFGKSSGIKNAFGRYGWYIKEAGERESVFQAFCYLLSHWGFRKAIRQ